MRRVLLLTLVLVLGSTSAALADFVFATGTFTLTSGTGTQQITDATCAQPKVVIVWWNRATTDATFSATGSWGLGVAVDAATDQVADMEAWGSDNQGTTDSAYAKHTSGFIANIANGTSGFNDTATISSFNSNGFTINKVTNDGTNLNIHHYVCLGGSDITNAYLGEFALTTGTGSQSFTGVGFQGTFGLFFGGWFGTAGDQTGARFYHWMGAANGTQQNAVSLWAQDATTSANAAESYVNSSNAIAMGNLGAGGINSLASLTSFDADGFTINKGVSAGTTRQFFGLILKGTFQSHIGQQARLTSTTTQDITTPGFQPTGVMIVGAYPTADATETTHAHMILGAGTSSSTDHGAWFGDESTINTEINQYSSASNIYTQAAGPSTVSAQAGLNAMLSNGYQLNWTTTDATARLFWHMVFAGAAGASRSHVSPIMFQ